MLSAEILPSMQSVKCLSGKTASCLLINLFKSFLAGRNFCHLLILTFANSLDPDQAQQSVGPDLDPNCLTLWCYSWKSFLKKLFFIYPACKLELKRKGYNTRPGNCQNCFASLLKRKEFTAFGRVNPSPEGACCYHALG